MAKRIEMKVVSMNEHLNVDNKHGEYGLLITLDGRIIEVVDGLTYEQAEMELRMQSGGDVSFEEYHEIMSQ